MREEAVLRLSRFAIRKNGDAAMSLATVLTTLTNLSTWYGQKGLETTVSGSSMWPEISTTTFVKPQASAI